MTIKIVNGEMEYWNIGKLENIVSKGNFYLLSSPCTKTLCLIRKRQEQGLRNLKTQEFTNVNDWVLR